MSLNRTFTSGNITRDIEVKFSGAGTAIANFSIAVNEVYIKDGNKVETTSFVDITAFGKTAENIGKFFAKGDQILIEGKLKQDTWEDKQTGAKRSKLGIIVEKFHFMGGGKKDSGQQSSPRQEQRQPARSGAPANKPVDDWEDNPPF